MFVFALTAFGIAASVRPLSRAPFQAGTDEPSLRIVSRDSTEAERGVKVSQLLIGL